MSTPESPQPRSGGAHRASPAGAPATSASPLLLPLLSVVAVLAAMGLAAWMLMTAGDDATDTAPPTGAVSQPTGPASTQPTPSEEPSDQPSDEPTKDDGKKDDGKKDDGKKDDDEPSAQPVPQIAVYVFNQTTVSGLAAQTADRLEVLGWDVVGVDNWVGIVPEDTVYFYPGDRPAAEQLAKAARVDRVWPASAPMPAGALTLILADPDRK